MIPHICIILFVILAYLLSKSRLNLSYGKQLVFIVLWLYSGLRYYVGIDFKNYKAMYDLPEHMSNLYLEPIWIWLSNLLRSFNFSSQAWFLLTSFIIVYLFFYGIKKLSPNFYLSVALFVVGYFYFESMNGIRQYVAVSILFAAFHFVLKKKIWLYILAIILAMQFHKSAIFMLPMIFIVRIKYPLWLLLPTLLLTFFAGNQLMMFVVDNLSSLFIGRYKFYDVNAIPVEISTGLLKIFLNLIAVGVLFIAQRVKSTFADAHIYANMIVIGVITYNIFILFQPAMRLYWYLFPFIIIFIPISLKSFTQPSRVLLASLLILIFTSFTIKQMYSANSRYNINLKLFK